MAEMHADRRGHGAAAEQGNSLTAITYGIGSLISLGLIVGLGYWGYQLVMRDVSGVPVIRAAQGPMRVQPEEPGGRQALNQGLAVNDVAAVGAAAKTPDELILAPAPLDLSDEDGAAVWAERPEPQAAAHKVEVSEPADQPEAAAEEADILALAESLAEGVEPMSDKPADEAEELAEAQDAPRVEGGLGHSLRPRLRPVTLSRIETTAASAPAAQDTQDITADSIPSGTRLAQLGAYKSEEIAREEWGRLNQRFEEYLADKGRVIQRATSGGRTFYRLRAMGFDDLADARRFCSALVAEKAECIPVVTR
ncbi:SPOR domain-containing protein [Roseovarius spongiae]|uniref:SPOR domain-containing protein n=1 Tax=Roseovarius spongiae TaxID=2320272 RepID=A0A3A8BC13_9RHOB|nr:SPOR domain-containing protein [Roseovarius spongiae]RKF17062.1 SPOR domain-containing protein [Roseovarius spongiae]